MTRVSSELAGQSPFDRCFYAFGRTVTTSLTRAWCRVTIEGREHVPATGAFVLCPVHRSILDTPIAACVTRRRMRFMGADKYWASKLGNRLLSALGGFPVTRGSADREALKRCIELLEAGEPLVLFPEGERKSGPLVQPLFDGATYVAVRTGVPIVPVGIGGSERAMPRGAKFIRPAKVHVIVGEPIAVPIGTNSKAQRLAARELTLTVHAELQRLFDAANERAARGRRRT